MTLHHTCSPLELGDPNSDTLVVMIHGYSSHPEIFTPLAYKCVERLGAYVCAPVLYGHCHSVDQLYHVTFQTFIDDINTFITLLQARGRHWKRIIVVGDCFGSYVASHAAERLNADAIVMTSTPYSLRSPLSWRWVQWLLSFVRALPKLYLSSGRDGYLFMGYRWIPGNVLQLILDGNAFLRMTLPTLQKPVCAINLLHDHASYPEGVHTIRELSKNEHSCAYILESDMHVVHTSDKYRVAEEHIVSWIEKVLNIEYLPDLK